MDYVKLSVLVIIGCIGQAAPVVGVGCTLDRNRQNPFPYMLKLVINGTIRCHGALLTPKLAMTALKPIEGFKDIFDKMTFIAEVFGSNGEEVCTEERKASVLYAWPNTHRDAAYFKLAERFDVTLNKPFMFKRIEDIDSTKIREMVGTFQSDSIHQPCILPVYSSRSPNEAKIKVDVVKIMSGEMVDYWMNVLCKNTPSCGSDTKKDRFFVYDLDHQPEPSEEWNWYAGAVIYCWGKPLGTLSRVIQDVEEPVPTDNGTEVQAKTPKKVTVFESLAYSAWYIHLFSFLEWPKPTTTTTTTTTEATTTEETTTEDDYEGVSDTYQTEDYLKFPTKRLMRSLNEATAVTAHQTTVYVTSICIIYRANSVS